MKGYKLLIFCILLIVIISCQNDGKVDELGITEDKMVELMLDLRVIENQINKHHVLDRDSVSILYKKMLFEIHDIDSVTLAANLSILQNNPRLLKKIEDKVLKKIANLQDEIRENK